MTDRPMADYDDAVLEGALRSLASAIDWPMTAPIGPAGTAVGPDIATRVRVRLTTERRTDPNATPWWRLAGRPFRRSVILALAAILALAVVAGAVGLGLPGLRIILGEPSVPLPTVAPSRSPTPGSPTVPGVPGARLGLGRLVALDDVETLTGSPVRLPADPRLGPPDAVYVDASKASQVAYVWAESDELPAGLEPGVGLVLMRFDGRGDDEFYQKVISTGSSAELVQVDGRRGYWISGEQHFFFYVRPDGSVVDDSRRWVGDALVWSEGQTTYRIESALGLDATIALAESLE